MWLWWLACSGDDTEVPTDVATDGTETSGTTGDTGVTTTGPARVEVVDGPINTMRSLHVTLTDPATAAARCVATSDPAEILFAESPTAALEHDLRMGGLLPDTAYECRVVFPDRPEIDTVVVSLTSGIRPALLPEAQVTVSPTLGMTGAFTMGSWLEEGCQGSNRQSWLVLWDAAGKIRWWKRLVEPVGVDVEALYHPDIDAVVWGGGESKKGPVTIEPLWSATPSYAGELHPDLGTAVFHHDGARLADGTLLMLEGDLVEDEADTWIGFRIRRQDPMTGEMLLDVRSQTYYDQRFLTRWQTGNLDQYHANALFWRETANGPLLFVSLCFEQAILVINGDTGDLLMRLDKTWNMREADGTTLPGTQFPQCQHGIEAIDDNTLLVYDNGRNRQETRAQRLHVDRASHTLTREWNWTDGRFEGSGGDIDPLGPDRVLLTFAHMECLVASDGLNEVVEVDVPSGEIASRLVLPDENNIVYRAQRYDGCEFLPGTRYCASAMQRATELGPLFDR